MDERRNGIDSVALHALARRERSRLMAHYVRRLVRWIAGGVRAAPTLAADRAAAG